MDILVTAIISMLFYTTSAGLHAVSLAGKLRGNKVGLLLGGAIAVLIQAWLLYRWIDISQGQNLNLLNVFSLITWLMALLLILLALGKPLENLCLLVYPLAALSMLLILIFPRSYVINLRGDTGQLLHVWLSLITLSVLLIAVLQAIMLFWQDHLLRHKPASKLLVVFPPMQVLERLLFQLLGFGFVLLSVFLLSAISLLPLQFTSELWHKSIFGMLAWLLFALLLLGRWIFGWRGRTAIRFTLLGTLLLVAAYLGTRLT